MTESRPNVLYIMTDQHNYRALSCAGHETVETPNIDRLAESGLYFENAYCPSPVCGPSRAALFSGLFPRANGVTDNWVEFDDGVPVLPQLLQENGYHTALVGKLHFEPVAKPHGFDYIKKHDSMHDLYESEEPWNSAYVKWLADKKYDGDVQKVIDRASEEESSFVENQNLRRFLMGDNWRSAEEHSNTWVANEACEYLHQHRDEPFFLFASFFGPHQPMAAPGKWSDMYDPDEITLPEEFYLDIDDKPAAQAKSQHRDFFRYYDRYDWSEDQYREILAAYYGQVSMIDEKVGEMLDELDRQGLADDTIVVFTSDHGDHAGQFGWFHKTTMYEGSAHVPLVVRDPGYDDASGERTGSVVNNMDLFDTILERCGVEYDGPSHARSLVPLFENPKRTDWENETYSELHSRGGWSMLIQDDYKLLRAKSPEGDWVHELYDLTTSPRDAGNLWDDPEYRDVQQHMVQELQKRHDEYATRE